MRRLFALVATVALLSGCGGGSASRVAPDDLEGIAERTALAPREFEVSQFAYGTNVRIAGVVQDGYRYAATVYVDERPLFEEVVIDDARYLRLLDVDVFAARGTASPDVAVMLGGGWVVDPAGAPPEFGPASLAAAQPEDRIARAFDPTFKARLLGPLTVLGEVRFLDSVPSLLRIGSRPVAWNPDAASYLEADDRFPPYREDGTRFDSLPHAFDPGATLDGIASLQPYYQTVAVWTRDDAVTRVERAFELRDVNARLFVELLDRMSRDDRFITSIAGRAGISVERVQQLMQRTIDGLTTDDLREADSHTMRAPPAGVRVRAPSGAIRVDLGRALAALAGSTR